MREFFKRCNVGMLKDTSKNVYATENEAKRRLEVEMSKLEYKLKSGEITIGSNHPIYQLLRLYCPPTDVDDETFRNLIEYDIRDIEKKLNMGNMANTMLPSRRNELFKSNAVEYYVQIDGFVGETEDIPIKIVETNNIDIRFDLFNGTTEFENKTIVVVGINIENLFFDYKEYVEMDEDRDYLGYMKERIIPILNESWLDLSSYNRLLYLFHNGFLQPLTNPNPMDLLDCTRYVDSLLNVAMKRLKSNNLRLPEFVYNCPTLYNLDMLEVLHNGVYNYTLDGKHNYYLCHLRKIVETYEALSHKGQKASYGMLTDLTKDLTAMTNKTINFSKMVLDQELLENYEEYVVRLRNLLKR